MSRGGEVPTAPLEGMEREEPMTRQVLDSPEMQAKIAKAKARAREGKMGSGKTADELLNLSREQRNVDRRP